MDNDAILGSLTIYGDSCYVTEAEANTSIEAKLLGVHVHDLLRDSIVKFCFENNIRFYDLAGFNPRRRSSNKELGIKFSKSKFNAQEYKYLILNK